MPSLRRSFVIFSFLAVSGFVSTQIALAQPVAACQTTNSLAIGTYGFVLNAGAFFQGVTTNPPGTTGAIAFQPMAVNPPGTTGSVTLSNTELGRLFGGIAGTAVGAVAGQLYFDGNGNVFAAATVGGAPSTLAGTYTVNSDCTISVMLTDAFSTATHPATLSLTGFLVSGGTEIDLIPNSQLPPAPGSPLSGAAAAVVPPASLIQFLRINAQTACSASTLTGPYALIGSGFTSANASAAFLARVRFDGAGNVVNDVTSGVTTPLTAFQYVGTYTVNPDCTGTLKLTQTAATTTTTTPADTKTNAPAPITVSFVITNPIVQVNSSGGVAFQSAFSLRPSFVFSLASQNQVVSGIGKAQ